MPILLSKFLQERAGCFSFRQDRLIGATTRKYRNKPKHNRYQAKNAAHNCLPTNKLEYLI